MTKKILGIDAEKEARRLQKYRELAAKQVGTFKTRLYMRGETVNERMEKRMVALSKKYPPKPRLTIQQGADYLEALYLIAMKKGGRK